MIPVRTHPGQRQLTPIGMLAACIELYRPSVMATTACLLASYGGAKPGYRPAIGVLPPYSTIGVHTQRTCVAPTDAKTERTCFHAFTKSPGRLPLTSSDHGFQSPFISGANRR